MGVAMKVGVPVGVRVDVAVGVSVGVAVGVGVLAIPTKLTPDWLGGSTSVLIGGAKL